MQSFRVSASRRLNLVQRALNRAGRPFGIAPFPVAWESVPDAPEAKSESIFEQFAIENFWNSSESISGPGSELARTERYRKALVEFLDREGIDSIFDAPCGDLNWMPDVLARHPMHYIGGDISPSVVAAAQRRNPQLDLRQFDICRDPFPEARVWHCRDAILHLSFADIRTALENAARSQIELALLTTYRARVLRNLDIRTGGWRFVDLERAPFNLPRPLEYLDDSHPREFPRAVGVWPLGAIRAALDRR